MATPGWRRCTSTSCRASPSPAVSSAASTKRAPEHQGLRPDRRGPPGASRTATVDSGPSAAQTASRVSAGGGAASSSARIARASWWASSTFAKARSSAPSRAKARQRASVSPRPGSGSGVSRKRARASVSRSGGTVSAVEGACVGMAASGPVPRSAPRESRPLVELPGRSAKSSGRKQHPAPDGSDCNAWIRPAAKVVADRGTAGRTDGLHARRPGHPWERARARRHSRPRSLPRRQKSWPRWVGLQCLDRPRGQGRPGRDAADRT